tara:strand:- start:53 stop:502 length:450 start_codon:yes stop_codon:yes gene_type:complete
MSLFDICPDIEELIVDELNVLLKFREAAQELKLRIKLNERSIKAAHKEHNRYYGGQNTGMPRIILYSLFPYMGKKTSHHYSHYNQSFKKVECANIHGFLYDAKYNRYSPNEKWKNNCTIDLIDAKLTEIGATKFKSKKKADKIKLLMKY